LVVDVFSIVVLGFAFFPVRWHVCNCAHSFSHSCSSPLRPHPPTSNDGHISNRRHRCGEFCDNDEAATRPGGGGITEQRRCRCRRTTTTTAMTSGEEEDAAVAAAVAAVSPGRPIQEVGPDAANDEGPAAATAATATGEMFQWTPPLVMYAMTIFILTGCAEIMGGWLVYTAVVRDNDDNNADADRRQQQRRWWMIPLGSLIPT
jgi:hypothetical protein